MITSKERLSAVMANTGFGTLKFATKYGDTLIEAFIPSRLLTKAGEIPRAILGMIKFPSAENRLKLSIRGIKVKYTMGNKNEIFAAA